MDKIIRISGHKVELTHLDKILFPKPKVIKKDLIDYYFEAGKFILPYLKDRPVTLLRCPMGIKKECWIQKEAPEKLPSFVKTFTDYSKLAGHKVNYVLVDNLAALIW